MFYLWPGSEGRRPQRRYTWQAAGREVLRFDFETVCLWELGASELLARPAPGQWTLTPLCANAGPAEVARAIRQIVEAGGPAHTHHDLAAAAVTLAQRRFGAHDITHWLPRGILMDLAELEEFKALFPDVVERWERQARQTGLEAGREEGREEGREILRAVCASTVEAKLGAVAADVAKRLAALQDLALLRRLAVDLGAAQDREAVLAVLRRAGV
jgi:hypothetical protein